MNRALRDITTFKDRVLEFPVPQKAKKIVSPVSNPQNKPVRVVAAKNTKSVVLAREARLLASLSPVATTLAIEPFCWTQFSLSLKFPITTGGDIDTKKTEALFGPLTFIN